MKHPMTTTLNDGVVMPMHGLGVFQTEEGDEVANAVTWALEAGYRHIDTASIYRNEEGVGRAISASEIERDQVFVTTKVWNSDQGYERTLGAFDASLNRLGMDYVDLYLIHWPIPDLTADTWRAMEKLKSDGLTRSIGVSNFEPEHLDQLFAAADVVPTVNQVELHPHLQQRALREFCGANDIRVEAWSPLKRGAALDDQAIVQIAERLGRTSAQVILRWQMQCGIITIPKSVHKSRIIENADVFNFELTDDDMERMASCDRDDRFGPHPDGFAEQHRPDSSN